MRNLVLCSSLSSESILDSTHSVDCIAYDNDNGLLYLAANGLVHGYHIKNKNLTSQISLIDAGYVQSKDSNSILNLQYLFDQFSVFIATRKGDLLLWYADTASLECLGSVEAGFTCAAWSPDQDLLVLTTGSDSYILMTRDFDPIIEANLHSEEFGEEKPVNVGWGKKETQFHGTEGKEASQKQNLECSALNSWDDHRTEISWRGDGQYFAISAVDANIGCRKIRIFNRDGILQSSNELIDGLENCISWRPSGNLIATTQMKPNKHDVIFLETNGLQHGEFSLPFPINTKQIELLTWNPTSDVLAILVRDRNTDDSFSVQLWTTGNYHWYLKQELRLPSVNHGLKSRPHILWDPEESLKLHIITQNTSYRQLLFTYDVDQSYGNTTDNWAMVAVIDGSRVLLTPFEKMTVPPPMSAFQLDFPSAVNQLSFGPHNACLDVLLLLSDMQFCVGKFDRATMYHKYHKVTLQQDNSIQQLSGVRHLLWWNEMEFLFICDDEDDGNDLCLCKFHETGEGLSISLKERFHMQVLSESKVQKIFKGDDNKTVFALLEDLSVWKIGKDDGDDLKVEMLLTISPVTGHITHTHSRDQDTFFGLQQEQYRLYMNNTEVASNCTSFALHNDFLLLTTHSHTLRCIYLKSLLAGNGCTEDVKSIFDEAVRKVERGSKIVTVSRNGTAVVLQMPRGNLEVIHPRALIVSHLQYLLGRLDYKEAFVLARKHRINLNLMVDHNPQLFLENVSKFVEDVDSVNHLNLFLAELSQEDVTSTLYFPFYHHGQDKSNSATATVDTSKVNRICLAMRTVLEAMDSEKYLLSILTTFAKQTVPDLETVLVRIKKIKDMGGHGGVDHNAALKYMLYLIDVNNLFNVALGLYDFDIVLMIAQKSQKDPKEYLPFLNNFKNMEINYQRFSIDKYLKRFSKALTHLVKCPGRLDECIEFIKEHKLYTEALHLFPTNSMEYKSISFHYGDFLLGKKRYNHAGIVFSRCSHHKRALESFVLEQNWCLAIVEAKKLSYSNEELMNLANQLSESLKKSQRFSDAAVLLETYANNCEDAIACLIEGHLWNQSLHMIFKHDRPDIIETNLKPVMLEAVDDLSQKLREMSKNFELHRTRLIVVLQQKQQEAYELAEGLRDEPDNDLFSDTSSITGQSMTSASSKSSRSSGHSSKSRRKVQRKKYSLREGSKNEDFALREALAEIVNQADSIQEEVSALVENLVLYFHDDLACQLQREFRTLSDLIAAHTKEIWSLSPSPVASYGEGTATERYGASATVNSILANRGGNPDVQEDVAADAELPNPTKATFRSNISWHMDILKT